MQLSLCMVWGMSSDVSDQLPPECLLHIGIPRGWRSIFVNFKTQAESQDRAAADGGHKLTTENARGDNGLDKELYFPGGLPNPLPKEAYVCALEMVMCIPGLTAWVLDCEVTLGQLRALGQVCT